MLPKNNPYNSEILGIEAMQKITPDEITEQLNNYLDSYKNCFVRSQQIRYFTSFTKGLLSNLDRKSIEPIALSFLGESAVRGMQDFFTRSKGWYESLSKQYKEKLAETLNGMQGFLSIDESDFIKKGNDSAGVVRQYCGRLGKTENCQAGVFISYASDKGIGLVGSRLYLPKIWFSDEYEEKRNDCQIPSETTFKTKNEIAKEMVDNIIESQLFEIQCIGCDAAFGSDHSFIDSLPASVYYFASVRENENIFREMPNVLIPNSTQGKTRFRFPRSEVQPVAIKTIVDDDSVPWVKRAISEGAKGSIIAEIKCLRCVSSRNEHRVYVPKSEVWVYIRKHEDGTIKYFVSNMPGDISIDELDRLSTARWSIEQCFQECKSYLGMTHYETRSYQAWHRHMLLVMIAHLFVTVFRMFLKKICRYYNADGSLHHRGIDSCADDFGVSHKDCALSFAP